MGGPNVCNDLAWTGSSGVTYNVYRSTTSPVPIDGSAMAMTLPVLNAAACSGHTQANSMLICRFLMQPPSG
jgi:hypothetical protein